ncbi:MAG: DUF2441 domain-containing protein [Deltaproteobacteria bacterium]|nr:DUF2441 domain-containing protein [Deltaproteobacteria bacterium]
MNHYFHVDRAGRLSDGLEVRLSSHADVDPPFLQAHLHSQFPKGVSVHGERYFASGAAASMNVEANLELIWEMSRRHVRPSAPARAESMFAWERVDDAYWFRGQFGAPRHRIWEIECQKSGFRADPRWLTLAGSALATSHAAHSYWSGEPVDGYWPALSGAGLRWEILVPMPVTVVRCIE